MIFKKFKAATVQTSPVFLDVEKTIEKAQAKGTRAAPGMHAHLALLYFNLGRDEDGIGHLVTEKQLFPESATFINFLIEKQGQF